MSILRRFFRNEDPKAPLAPLYAAVVAAARQPEWYLDGQVPDTLDGRFDMVAAMLSLLLIRLERDGEAHATESALLAEIFVDDMDGQLREIGIGDIIVGKHIGRMMGALGGRLGAYRAGLVDEGDLLAEALVRNVWRGEQPDAAALAWTTARVRALFVALEAMPGNRLIAGEWPAA